MIDNHFQSQIDLFSAGSGLFTHSLFQKQPFLRAGQIGIFLVTLKQCMSNLTHVQPISDVGSHFPIKMPLFWRNRIG